MKKPKTDMFRPEIPDESGELRKRFAEECRRSGMTRAGFARRALEIGMVAVADRAEAIDRAEVRP